MCVKIAFGFINSRQFITEGKELSEPSYANITSQNSVYLFEFWLQTHAFLVLVRFTVCYSNVSQCTFCSFSPSEVSATTANSLNQTGSKFIPENCLQTEPFCAGLISLTILQSSYQCTSENLASYFPLLFVQRTESIAN